jgi:hypothetical protein
MWSGPLARRYSGHSEGSIVLFCDTSIWTRGFEQLALPHVQHAAEQEWEQAVEVLFSATQSYAHVLSGDMVDTGDYEMSVEGTQVIGAISYGGLASNGNDVDYVKYELGRGGSHDFYARAMHRSRERLEKGTADMLKAAFRAAFGGV